jgi:Tfp pilus assembly protein PilN
MGLSITRSVALCAHVSSALHESVGDDDLARCQGELERLSQFHRRLVESKNSQRRPIQILRIFERAMPADVWLRELIVSENSIGIVGASRSEASVGALFGSLRVVDAFTNPHLESSQVATESFGEVREFRMSGMFAVKSGEAETSGDEGL